MLIDSFSKYWLSTNNVPGIVGAIGIQRNQTDKISALVNYMCVCWGEGGTDHKQTSEQGNFREW